MEKEKKMEGLIPLFYRAIKRNRIRNQYSSLESESVSVSKSNYDIADFYVNPPRSHIYPNSSLEIQPQPQPHRHHRRHNSVGDFELSDRRNTSGGATPKQQQQQQLVRFRSQRILSCLTGH